MSLADVLQPVGDMLADTVQRENGEMNIDLLMVVSGFVLGAAIGGKTNESGTDELMALTMQTCEERCGIKPNLEGAPVSQPPDWVTSYCTLIVVRVMPHLEEMGLSYDDIAKLVAWWIGCWAGLYREYGIPSEEFIVTSYHWAEFASKIDKWTAHNADGALVGTWEKS